MSIVRLRVPAALLTLLALCAALLALGPPARAGQDGACALPARTQVGQPDPSLFTSAVGPVKALMLFVDFPDVVADSSVSTQALEDVLVPQSTALFRTMSVGRLDLQVTPERRWIRMPRPQSDYTYARGITFASHREYLHDAVAAADPSVDLSPYRVLYVVPVPGASNISFSPAFISPPGQGLSADGVEIRHAVSFGQDLHGWGSKVLNHETGHLFGLPDLYSYTESDAHRFVGGWDLMGFISGRSPGYLAWYRWTLGWLDSTQIVCVGPGTQDVVLTPVETAGGTKAVVLRTSPGTAVVAEYRRSVGEDSQACTEGLLVHSLDADRTRGTGPVRVVDARPTTTCGQDPLDDAPFGGDTPAYAAPDGSTLTVLAQTDDALTVRVTRPGNASPSPDPTPSSTPPAHVRPKLTLSASGPVTFGTVVRVTLHGTPGARVDLFSRSYPNTAFTRIRTGLLLDSTGRAAVDTRPHRNLRLAAEDPAAPGLGNQPLVQVRKRLSLDVACTGRRCTFSGSAKPFSPEQRVELYRGTTLVRRMATSGSGAWSVIADQPRGTATYTVRTRATGYNAASSGPTRTVRIG